MDLAPGKSLIEWAVQHGHTCFAISYRNPDAVDARPRLRATTCSTARSTRCASSREITGAPEVNTVSVCLGGTLTAIGLAHNAARRRPTRSSRPRSSTPTPTSREPGVLGVVHRRGDDRRPREADGQEGLPRARPDGAHLRRAAGQRPGVPLRRQQLAARQEAAGVRPAGLERRQHPDAGPDALASTCARATCTTSSPAASSRSTASKLDPGRVDVDTYVLSAVDDHIVPWISGYKTTQLLGGKQPVRAQHLGPHRRHRQPAQPQGEALDQRQPPGRPAGVEGRGRSCTDGTWWDDWATWIADRAAARRSPAPRSSAARSTRRSSLRPGSYVRAKA